MGMMTHPLKRPLVGEVTEEGEEERGSIVSMLIDVILILTTEQNIEPR